MYRIKISFILLMTFTLLFSSSASAFEFDNVLDYKNDDLTVEITNLFGLGKKLGEATLASHSTVNDVRSVIRGKNRVPMFYDFNFSDRYSEGLGEVFFIDKRTGEIIQKDFRFVYSVEVPYEFPILERINCRIIHELNGSSNELCDSKINYETRYKTEWKILNTTDITSGEIRIGLQTDVNPKDFTEAIWTIAGKKISKHASWTESFNNDLFAYYKFEDNNETITGEFNLSAFEGSPTFTTDGKIGSAGNTTDGNNFKIAEDDGLFAMVGENFSLSFWAKPADLANAEGFIRKLGAAGKGWGIHQLGTGDLRFGLGWGNTDFSGILTVGEWTMITVNVNSSGSFFYKNGSLQGKLSTDITEIGTQDVHIGDGNGWSGNDYNGLFDEMGWWNRSLSDSEINDLYNGGAGITHTLEFDTCTCAGLNNNWEINMADYCFITSECILGTGTLNFTGEGNVSCDAVVNTTNLGPLQVNQTLFILDDCVISIK